MTASFTGFLPSAFEFLRALATDNTKAFFDHQRETYRREIAAPAMLLVTALALELPLRVHPRLRGEARVGRSLFRINRDTRFSADKTPYKPYIDFLFWAGDDDPRTCPAAIMRITGTTVLVGAGRVGIRGVDLAAYRDSIVDTTRGPEVRAIVDQLVATGAELSDPSRATVPRPYPADHLNGDLLRRDGFHLTHTRAHPAAIASSAFVDWCVDAFAPYSPLIDWLTA
ncbi:MAG TPA: DUF2461 domain-containing protein [Acidimicrobiales bacterium]|nr:DUF2461 domain-containing protein [Acidimicrobiales bacterium]